MIGALIAKYKINHAYDALNRRDFEAFLSDWRDDCTFVYPGDLPVSGKFEGKDAIAKWFKNFLEQFPKLTFTVKNLCVDNVFDFVGTNTVAAHWEYRLHKQRWEYNSKQWRFNYQNKIWKS